MIIWHKSSHEETMGRTHAAQGLEQIYCDRGKISKRRANAKWNVDKLVGGFQLVVQREGGRAD